MITPDGKYCVAIRTLGKAGEKYQRLLRSIACQTLMPQKVLVYIPYGYDLPTERLDWETFVRCEKGMVAQRSLPYDEVTTDYCLFCDDDISFPADFVERLFADLVSNQGDCISPDSFQNHKLPLSSKIVSALMWAAPRRADQWAFKINRYTSGYSYNNSPGGQTLQSQSAAFPCFLCRMDAFRSIHYEDERWLDRVPYGLGDDQLFFYKLYLTGYRLLVCYESGMEHLDAKTSKQGDERMRFKQAVFVRCCLWYRLCFKLRRNNLIDKVLCIFLFGSKMCSIYLYHLLWSLARLRFYRLTAFFVGLMEADRYVHSREYLAFPAFDAHMKNQ